MGFVLCFFQAEDGIRDVAVTGVQTCALPISFGLSYPVDVAFLDRRGAVVALYHRLAPGHASRWHRAAVYALELPVGTLAMTDTRQGDTLAWHALAGLPSGPQRASIEAAR